MDIFPSVQYQTVNAYTLTDKFPTEIDNNRLSNSDLTSTYAIVQPQKLHLNERSMTKQKYN